MSNNNGEDLEIKIEWDNNDGTTSSRYFKGWPLNLVFDYTIGGTGSGGNSDVYSPDNNITVYAKWNEDDDWYSSSQKIRHGNLGWDWCFNESGETSLNHTQPMSGKIGYNNVGFMLHGNYNTKDWETASMI